MDGDDQTAASYYAKALELDPDYRQALVNLVGLEMYRGNFNSASEYIRRLKKAYPNDQEIKELSNRLKM